MTIPKLFPWRLAIAKLFPCRRLTIRKVVPMEAEAGPSYIGGPIFSGLPFTSTYSAIVNNT